MSSFSVLILWLAALTPLLPTCRHARADEQPAAIYESHIKGKTLTCTVDDTWVRYDRSWTPGTPLPIAEEKMVKGAKVEIARHVLKPDDWSYCFYELIPRKVNNEQKWHVVTSFENRKDPLEGASNSQLLRVVVNFFGNAMPLRLEPPGGNPFHILLWDHPEFDKSVLSPIARGKLDALKPEMTRKQLSKDFRMDGGYYSFFDQRYYLRDTPAPGSAPSVFMFDVFFKPVGMDEKVFSDPKQRDQWMHNPRNNASRLDPDDIAEVFSEPYIHYPSFE
jgi:hypothetical protein